VLTGILRDERVGMVVWEWGLCGRGGLEGSHVRDESRRVCHVDGGANGETALLARRSLNVRRVSHIAKEPDTPHAQARTIRCWNTPLELLYLLMRFQLCDVRGRWFFPSLIHFDSRFVNRRKRRTRRTQRSLRAALAQGHRFARYADIMNHDLTMYGFQTIEHVCA
jgi:hypothetical protein